MISITEIIKKNQNKLIFLDVVLIDIKIRIGIKKVVNSKKIIDKVSTPHPKPYWKPR